MDRQRSRSAVIALATLAMSACGGGGTNTPPPSRPGVTVSGTVSYEFVPPNGSCTTLNFGATVTRPIRGATVQLINSSSGVPIASVASGADGSYAFNNVPRNTSARLRVRAELKDGGSAGWDVDVRDNYIAGASDLDNPAPPALTTR
ncbi:MAG: carboxypeptidase-like regulatory domain-containing protein, partial [Gammaproteobacteria bacterium]|nr:carboxypeptidase-like regulatory domain-containing protein [Gammaproteobacteria bacterium]